MALLSMKTTNHWSTNYWSKVLITELTRRQICVGTKIQPSAQWNWWTGLEYIRSKISPSVILWELDLKTWDPAELLLHLMANLVINWLCSLVTCRNLLPRLRNLQTPITLWKIDLQMWDLVYSFYDINSNSCVHVACFWLLGPCSTFFPRLWNISPSIIFWKLDLETWDLLVVELLLYLNANLVIDFFALTTSESSTFNNLVKFWSKDLRPASVVLSS